MKYLSTFLLVKISFCLQEKFFFQGKELFFNNFHFNDWCKIKIEDDKEKYAVKSPIKFTQNPFYGL